MYIFLFRGDDISEQLSEMYGTVRSASLFGLFHSQYVCISGELEEVCRRLRRTQALNSRG